MLHPVPEEAKCKEFIKNKLFVDNEACKEIEKKTHVNRVNVKNGMTREMSADFIDVWLCNEEKKVNLSI